MALFYLVNNKNKDVSYYTWQTVNITVAIFCAVVLFGVIRDVSLAVVGARTTGELAFWHLDLFFTLYIMLQISLYFLKKVAGGMYLLPVGTIFAHITAFAAMYGFAMVMKLAPFSTAWYWALSLVAINAAVQIGLTELSAWIRIKVAMHGDNMIDESEERWIEEVKESETDFFALSIGFGLMQVLRFWITGSLQSHEALVAPEGVTWGQTFTLLGFAILLGILTPVTMFAMARDNRWAKLLHMTIAMCFAMCTLYVADWHTYLMGFEGVRLAGCMLVALMLTIFAILNIFVLQAIQKNVLDSRMDPARARKTLESIVMAFAIMVGLSWEKAFDIAMEAVHEDLDQYFSEGMSSSITKGLLPLFLLCIVMPAWTYHILPKAQGHEESEKEKLRPAMMRSQTMAPPQYTAPPQHAYYGSQSQPVGQYHR